MTFPTGLGLIAGGIITMSPPPEGLGCAPRAGLSGRGLCGGVDGGLDCFSDTICMRKEREVNKKLRCASFRIPDRVSIQITGFIEFIR